MATRPTIIPEWTDGAGSKIDQPDGAKTLLGWTPEEKPSPFIWNWLQHYNALWIEYLDQEVQSVQAQKGVYDAIVGIDGTHATINDVIADMDGVTLPVSDVRIFIQDPYTATTTQVIDKEGVSLEFHPRAAFSKGTVATGLQIDANRCKVLMGRFLNFQLGADIAIELTANADNCHILNNTFVNNNTSIQNDGANNTITGNIEEV